MPKNNPAAYLKGQKKKGKGKKAVRKIVKKVAGRKR